MPVLRRHLLDNDYRTGVGAKESRNYLAEMLLLVFARKRRSGPLLAYANLRTALASKPFILTNWPKRTFFKASAFEACRELDALKLRFWKNLVMGSSAKKKKEKKKDFQKTKLKVGKAKPQSANATSTSFKAKSIVLNQQINANAPSTNNQFSHHVSLLSSRSDSQRKESLSYLASILSGPLRDQPLPVSSEHLLDKSMPLILDANHGVRSELYKVLQAMPSHHLRDHITRIIPYVRAAMTHLSADIRKTALDVLSWLLSSTGEDLVSCPGGWTKTLDCCATLLNWKNLASSESWTASKSHFRSDTKAIAQAMQVIYQALTIGLLPSDKPDRTNQDFSYPLCDYEHHRLPSKANAYGYLDLFGKPIDDDSRMLEGREERLIVFKDRFQSSFVRGTEGAKKEGGDLGRIAGQLSKTLDAVARDD